MSDVDLIESGVYSVSLSEDDLNETSYDANVGNDNFAYAPAGEPPSARKFKIGDAEHVKLAVSAFVNWSFRGNAPDIPASAKPGVKSKIASAIHKHLKGDEAKYYSTWLSTGKKPDSKSVSETHMHEMYIAAPNYRMSDEARFPDVPTAPGVNLGALTAGDPNPVFVTRPLAILDEVSENGLVYNQAVFNDVYQQVIAKRPVARRGHIAEADKSSLFPPDDGYWIGAVIDETVYGKPTVFGKCYVVPGPMRDMVLRRRATSTSLSNSLWGDVTMMQAANGDMEPLSVEIESIDFVPEERAALQALGGDYRVTSEMLVQGVSEMADTDNDLDEMAQFKKKCAEMKPETLCEMATPEQRRHIAEAFIKECDAAKMSEMLSEGVRSHIAEAKMKEATPEETKNLSEATRKAIAESYCKESGMKMVKEEDQVTATATMSEMTKLKTSLSEMDSQLKRYQRKDFEQTLDKKVDGFFVGFSQPVTPKGIEQFTALKDQFRFRSLAEMAGMKDGQIVENIDAAVEVVAPLMKPLIEMYVSTASGPAAVVGAGGRIGAGSPATGWDGKAYSDDFVQRALQMTNALGGRSGGSRGGA